MSRCENLTLNGQKRSEIFLPAGDTKFTRIDVADIGNVISVILSNVNKHYNRAYTLTCHEKFGFGLQITTQEQ